MARPPYRPGSDRSITGGCWVLIPTCPGVLVTAAATGHHPSFFMCWASAFVSTIGLLVLSGRTFGVVQVLASWFGNVRKADSRPAEPRARVARLGLRSNPPALRSAAPVPRSAGPALKLASRDGEAQGDP